MSWYRFLKQTCFRLLLKETLVQKREKNNLSKRPPPGYHKLCHLIICDCYEKHVN